MLAASLRTTRLSLAEKLSQARLTLAAEATQRFHELHPDWVAKPGERGGRFCLDDACFHLDFLVGAIHAADPSAFRSYVRWTTGMLQARGIPAASVQEHVEHLFAAAGPFLSASECALLADYAPTADGSQGEIEAGGPHSTPLGLTRDLFVQAILNGSRKAAVGLMMESLRTGSTVTELYVEVLQEALYEVGRRWEANRITVAQEHMATAMTQYVMAQLYPHIPSAETTRGRAIITGVQGELHHVGANMVADLMEADGWDVRFLGTNLPHEGIVEAVEEHQADLLGISATLLASVPRVRALISGVREKLGSAAPQIVVGGAAFRSSPDLCSEVGADRFAPDARAAVGLHHP